MQSPIKIFEVLPFGDWTCEQVLKTLNTVRWENGEKTAGPIAAAVKRNLQADPRATLSLRGEITSHLLRHPEFCALVRPQSIALMFSRYTDGGRYGRHVDSAIVDGMRRDVSFTIWLNDPDKYEGGELVIDVGFDELMFKPNAGDMVVYPATSLHRVDPVTRGTRTVIVGWARSYIRDPAQRELLFELDLAKAKLFADGGSSNVVDLLSRCSANLQRMWLDD